MKNENENMNEWIAIILEIPEGNECSDFVEYYAKRHNGELVGSRQTKIGWIRGLSFSCVEDAEAYCREPALCEYVSDLSWRALEAAGGMKFKEKKADILSPECKEFFIEIVEDAANWSGAPLYGGNIESSMKRNGFLTDLKKKGLIKTVEDQQERGVWHVWIYFLKAGVDLAIKYGTVKKDESHYLRVLDAN